MQHVRLRRTTREATLLQAAESGNVGAEAMLRRRHIRHAETCAAAIVGSEAAGLVADQAFENVVASIREGSGPRTAFRKHLLAATRARARALEGGMAPRQGLSHRRPSRRDRAALRLRTRRSVAISRDRRVLAALVTMMMMAITVFGVAISTGPSGPSSANGAPSALPATSVDTDRATGEPTVAHPDESTLAPTTPTDSGTPALRATHDNAGPGATSDPGPPTNPLLPVAPSTPSPPGGPLLTVVSAKAPAGALTTLSGRLLDEPDGNPIQGQLMDFVVNGNERCTGTTDVQGVAECQLAIQNEGSAAHERPGQSYPLEVRVYANPDLPKPLKELRVVGTFTVLAPLTHVGTRIRTTRLQIAAPGKPNRVGVTLSKTDTLYPVAGRSVSIHIGGHSCTARTNVHGQASCLFTLPRFLREYAITARFEGDDISTPTLAPTEYISPAY